MDSTVRSGCLWEVRLRLHGFESPAIRALPVDRGTSDGICAALEVSGLRRPAVPGLLKRAGGSPRLPEALQKAGGGPIIDSVERAKYCFIPLILRRVFFHFPSMKLRCFITNGCHYLISIFPPGQGWDSDPEAS